MGVYFTLHNLSTNTTVLSYWKGDPPSIRELEELAQNYKWDLSTDSIISTGGYSFYTLENNNWVEHDIDDATDYICKYKREIDPSVVSMKECKISTEKDGKIRYTIDLNKSYSATEVEELNED